MKKVMISSTILDLDAHRKKVLDACLRVQMTPLMMEHRAASNFDPIAECMRMIDEADIYLLILGRRYGSIPDGADISVTEMEYRRALERKMPRLIFIMHKNHRRTDEENEPSFKTKKAEEFRNKASGDRFVNFFKSPEDLRTKVVVSLFKYLKSEPSSFHHVAAIPSPPEPYIAHPYTLLQTDDLIGRQNELSLLSDWIAGKSPELSNSRILSLVSIGGSGKSALAWKWFREIEASRIRRFDGRIWWSFYESDASFNNFVIRSLAYITKTDYHEIENIESSVRVNQLITILQKENYLIILDGLERILMAYDPLDPSRVSEDALEKQVDNRPDELKNYPITYTEISNLRKTKDQSAGSFLHSLAREKHASRILITTRLHPQVLQNNITKEPVRGCYVHFLGGLTDDDALKLWRAFKVSGDGESLQKLFHTFENHPLMIRTLAAEVASYRRAPGDFERWKLKNPDFDPFCLPLKQRTAHVLYYALKGLSKSARKILKTVAPFRSPVTFDTLVALLLKAKREDSILALFFKWLRGDLITEDKLDKLLTDLDDRGLLGWNRNGNRYDMHPLVRGVVISGIDKKEKDQIRQAMLSHFQSIPTTRRWQEVNSIDDLALEIEHFNTLIELNKFEDAFTLFREGLNSATNYKLNANRLRIELLETFFPNTPKNFPSLSRWFDQAFVLNALALSYDCYGQPDKALEIYSSLVKLLIEKKDEHNLSIILSNMYEVQKNIGSLRKAEVTVRAAIQINRSSYNDKEVVATILGKYGVLLALRGSCEEAMQAYNSSFDQLSRGNNHFTGVVRANLAQLFLWQDKKQEAWDVAQKAWELTEYSKFERDIVHVKRIMGEIVLAQGDFEKAESLLNWVLIRARERNYVEEILPTLICLAKLKASQRRFRGAYEDLDDAIELSTRGPYRVFQSDALNLLAGIEIERKRRNLAKAVDAATKAYSLAWCDGPPYAYTRGLEMARKNLTLLKAAIPMNLPEYDDSRYEPLFETNLIV